MALEPTELYQKLDKGPEGLNLPGAGQDHILKAALNHALTDINKFVEETSNGSEHIKPEKRAEIWVHGFQSIIEAAMIGKNDTEKMDFLSEVNTKFNLNITVPLTIAEIIAAIIAAIKARAESSEPLKAGESPSIGPYSYSRENVFSDSEKIDLSGAAERAFRSTRDVYTMVFVSSPPVAGTLDSNFKTVFGDGSDQVNLFAKDKEDIKQRFLREITGSTETDFEDWYRDFVANLMLINSTLNDFYAARDVMNNPIAKKIEEYLNPTVIPGQANQLTPYENNTIGDPKKEALKSIIKGTHYLLAKHASATEFTKPVGSQYKDVLPHVTEKDRFEVSGPSRLEQNQESSNLAQARDTYATALERGFGDMEKKKHGVQKIDATNNLYLSEKQAYLSAMRASIKANLEIDYKDSLVDSTTQSHQAERISAAGAAFDMFMDENDELFRQRLQKAVGKASKIDKLKQVITGNPAIKVAIGLGIGLTASALASVGVAGGLGLVAGIHDSLQPLTSNFVTGVSTFAARVGLITAGGTFFFQKGQGQAIVKHRRLSGETNLIAGTGIDEIHHNMAILQQDSRRSANLTELPRKAYLYGENNRAQVNTYKAKMKEKFLAWVQSPDTTRKLAEQKTQGQVIDLMLEKMIEIQNKSLQAVETEIEGLPALKIQEHFWAGGITAAAVIAASAIGLALPHSGSSDVSGETEVQVEAGEVATPTPAPTPAPTPTPTQPSGGSPDHLPF